jgi:uncharacterized protein YndB with AHSA1/START domain
MNRDRWTARVSTTIDAPFYEVWSALLDRKAIREYMFGADVQSRWRVGSPIVWKGEWDGKPYEDRGEILKLEPGRTLQYSHFSPLSGLPDEPENYHVVTIELFPEGNGTLVSLTQDNNPTEEARAHSERNWGAMLAAMKKYLEG